MKGLAVCHIDMFFQLLESASPSGTIDLHTFVSGCLRMKGQATNLEVVSLNLRIQVLAKMMEAYMEESRQLLAEISGK